MDIVEHDVVYLADVDRVVSRAKGFAILCSGVEIGILIARGSSIIVVVTHSVEELGRITNIGKGLAERADIIEVVVPIYLVCTITQTEGVDRNTLTLVLLYLRLELRHKDVTEVTQVVVVVGNVNIGNGSNYMAVVIYLAQLKVVTLNCLGV